MPTLPAAPPEALQQTGWCFATLWRSRLKTSICIMHDLTAPDEYWRPICDLRNRMRCWVRMSIVGTVYAGTSDWGMLLTLPAVGYLEGPGGPVPIRQVNWVELCSLQVKGGLAERPLQFVDIWAPLLDAMPDLARAFDVRDALFSVSGVVHDHPARVLHFTNPFCVSSETAFT